MWSRAKDAVEEGGDEEKEEKEEDRDGDEDEDDRASHLVPSVPTLYTFPPAALL